MYDPAFSELLAAPCHPPLQDCKSPENAAEAPAQHSWVRYRLCQGAGTAPWSKGSVCSASIAVATEEDWDMKRQNEDGYAEKSTLSQFTRRCQSQQREKREAEKCGAGGYKHSCIIKVPKQPEVNGSEHLPLEHLLGCREMVTFTLSFSSEWILVHIRNSAIHQQEESYQSLLRGYSAFWQIGFFSQLWLGQGAAVISIYMLFTC